jgi:polyphenol oxidase
MAGWQIKKFGEIPVYQAATMSWLPGVVQGFTTRHGGVGQAPYDTLNLGLNCGDDAKTVEANRAMLAAALERDPDQLVYAEQVHGAGVAIVESAQDAPVAGADALITAVPGLILMLHFADCMPIYVVDPLKRVAALIHSGWRGTAADIVTRTTDVLKAQFDVRPRSCQVAIGPSIGADNYEVGSEVADRFRGTYSSGASTPVMPRNELAGTWSLNLRSIAFTQLLNSGYRAESIAVCAEDTFANSRDFFSHRRESMAGRSTGRMAGFLGLAGR